MKKTISIIAFFAMVCMFSNGIAETGYVIVKDVYKRQRRHGADGF